MQKNLAGIRFVKTKSKYHEDWYDWFSNEIPIPFLSNQKLRIQLEFSDEELDEFEEDIDRTIRNTLRLNNRHREQAKEHIFAYYQDVVRNVGEDCLASMPPLQNGKDLYNYVHFTRLSIAQSSILKKFYAVFSGGCDWEPEHGISLSFERGCDLAMVSSIGHVCNADAYGDEKKDKYIYIGN